MAIPNFTLQGKVAIVTGGSRCMGEGIALGFAEAGADVALCSRNLADVEQVADKIGKLGRKALPMKDDITKRSEIEKFVKQTVNEFGPPMFVSTASPLA